MRTYGRRLIDYANPLADKTGPTEWVKVETDSNGYNDHVYLTALIQVIKLNLGESPFWANYGIPARQSVVQQIAPDFWVMQTQTQFAPYFASLIIARIDTPEPTYNINALTHLGVRLNASIPIPT